MILTGCAEKEPKTITQLCPEFPNPSDHVLNKLTELNDYEVNAWLMQLSEHKAKLKILKFQ